MAGYLSPLRHLEKAQNEYMSFWLSERRSGIHGEQENDKALSVVNYHSLALKGSKLGLCFKEWYPANGLKSILSEYFFNNALATSFVSSYLVTSGLATEHSPGRKS